MILSVMFIMVLWVFFQVCVEKCPEENFYATSFTGTSDSYFLKARLICQLGTNLDGKKVPQLLELTKNGSCAEWYLESVSGMKLRISVRMSCQ